MKLPSARVVLSDGQAVEVRGLTYEQYVALGDVPDGQETMLTAIAFATEVSIDEARAWRAATPWKDVEAVADAVRRISRLDADAGEASGAPSSSARKTPSRSSSPNGSA